MREKKAKVQFASFFRFLKSVGNQKDPVMMLLRAHLYSEALLENFIRIGIPGGELINNTARLTFHQKLIIVEALGVLPSPLISSLRSLNKVRNEFSHEIDKELDFSDVSLIGKPLGRIFEETARETNSDTARTLKQIIGYLCGRLDGTHEAKKEISRSLAIKTPLELQSRLPRKSGGPKRTKIDKDHLQQKIAGKSGL